jgi:Fe-S cluster assembly iron-binding protein IscA
MLIVTNTAAILLKAAKAAEGASHRAGIRLWRGGIRQQPQDQAIAVGFAISDDPEPGDEEFEQNGLRIFVQEHLVEALHGRMLDVAIGNVGTVLVFR